MFVFVHLWRYHKQIDIRNPELKEITGTQMTEIKQPNTSFSRLKILSVATRAIHFKSSKKRKIFFATEKHVFV
jgi:hypothetical protein